MVEEVQGAGEIKFRTLEQIKEAFPLKRRVFCVADGKGELRKVVACVCRDGEDGKGKVLYVLPGSAKRLDIV